MDGNDSLLGNILPSTLADLNETTFRRKIAECRAEKDEDGAMQKAGQAAKDFESVLISKLLDEVKDTMGHFGFEQDGTSGQVHDIFWMYLARDIAESGGFGLWKDLYESIKR